MNIFDAIRENDIKAVKEYLENGGDTTILPIKQDLSCLRYYQRNHLTLGMGSMSKRGIK
jgi:hypothetical protein